MTSLEPVLTHFTLKYGLFGCCDRSFPDLMFQGLDLMNRNEVGQPTNGYKTPLILYDHCNTPWQTKARTSS